MGLSSWEIKGIEYGHCNCDYGCPCQFNGRPSSDDGDCRAVQFVHIDEGHYADVRLDGLRFAWLADWPGAVHEGNGEYEVIIDERADERQRDALRRIAYGEDLDEPSTPYAIFVSLCTTIHEPVYAPIELEFDMEARTAHSVVPGIIVADAEPVRNPVTGAPQRAQIVLPDGFSCTVMESASGTVKATGKIALDFKNKFAGFFKLHMSDRGIIRD